MPGVVTFGSSVPEAPAMRQAITQDGEPVPVEELDLVVTTVDGSTQLPAPAD